MYSMTFVGLFIALGGTFLVNTIGLTESCTTEITSKATEYAPLVIGSVVAYFGRLRMGGITWYGTRTTRR